MNSALHYSLIEDHREDGLRSGEGGVVALQDGTLLLHYTLFFDGGSDHSAAYIAERRSTDGGLTWTDPVPFFRPPEGALNAMGASVLRLQDGRIASLIPVKWSSAKIVPVWSVSGDEGVTWSEPRPVTCESEYFVVNNDRLIQLTDGTLVLPYARHDDLENNDSPEKFRDALNADCGLFYSRDGGDTWSRSSHTIKHTPAVYRPPLFVKAGPLHEDAVTIMEQRYGVFQEPGVVELSDGRLMLYNRSIYGIYRSFATGVEAEWTDCDVIEGFHVPNSPQTIRRLPGSNRLVMLYNDRGMQPWQTVEFNWRTPLSVAVSDDEGLTWKRLGTLEDDARNYCYFSFLFFGDRFIITYYESGSKHHDDGRITRRNLASLKVCTGPASLFLGDSL